jgi:hypothetical protein
VFSSGKETDTLRRNNLGAEVMEAIQMLKFALNNELELNFTKGTDMESELAELVALYEEQAAIPEDIDSFIRSLAPRTPQAAE